MKYATAVIVLSPFPDSISYHHHITSAHYLVLVFTERRLRFTAEFSPNMWSHTLCLKFRSKLFVEIRLELLLAETPRADTGDYAVESMTYATNIIIFIFYAGLCASTVMVDTGQR